MSAMECIDQLEINKSRDLSHRLVMALMSDGPDDPLFPNESLDDVIADYREFVRSLPG